METTLFSYLPSLAFYGVWVQLLYRGLRSGWLFRYPLFYGFVLVSLITHTVVTTWFAILSAREESSQSLLLYENLYFWSYLLVHLFILGILGSLYLMAGAPRFRESWLALLALPVLLAVGFLVAPTGPWWLRGINGILVFQTIFAFLVIARLYRNPHLAIGRNMGAVLAALFFPAAAQSLNYAGLFLARDSWPYSSFQTAIPLINLVVWLIVAIGMWRLDPPRFIDVDKIDPPQARRRLARLVARLWGLSKC